MIIATWNVERLKHRRRLDEIASRCMDAHADILVLTEADTRIELPYRHRFSSSPLSVDEGDAYLPTERRIVIFSRYDCVRQHETYDEKTALCVELKTEKGHLLVYGTIIGVHGNRRASFKRDLDRQLADYGRLSSLGDGLCICGDFNCSFADGYYYTKDARRKLLESFSENDIALLTKDRSACIDHIAVSSSMISHMNPQIWEWNLDKTLSDHKGIAVRFS